MIKEGTADGTAPLPNMVVVLNWLEELKRLLPDDRCGADGPPRRMDND